jgi:Flp pilus assembly protein TadG
MRRVDFLFYDDSGVSIVEFALIAPVLLLTLFGLLDVSHGLYTRSLLQGAIEKAARDSTIQAATTGALDAKVTATVKQIAPGATLTFNRKSYSTFSAIKSPEAFTDTNGDGTCDNGEPFEDANGNGVWDQDRGMNGNGGARDAVLYSVTVTYPRLFPVYRLINQSASMTMKSVSVLRNQPYSVQNIPSAIAYCP